MTTIVIIGTGNLARQWYGNLSNSDEIKVVAVVGRKAVLPFKIAPPTQSLNFRDPLPKADIYLLTVSDNAIAEVSENLIDNDCIIAHCSGAMPMDIMVPKGNRAVIYPLQTFSGDDILSFKNVPICVEYEDNKDLLKIQAFLSGVSERVEILSSEQRKYLHLAAVFVNNFVNHLYHIGHDIVNTRDIDSSLLIPLIVETTEKIKTLSALEAQTGPARRADSKTCDIHRSLLSNSHYIDIYNVMSKSIQKTYEEL